MATKTEIQNLINTINDGGLNTASEVRDVYELFKDALYPSIETDTQLTSNIFSDDGSGLDYTIRILKQGNVINIIGFIYNGNVNIIGSTQLMTTVNSEYTSEVPITYYGTQDANIRIAGGTISLVGSIGSEETIFLNLTYKNAD